MKRLNLFHVFGWIVMSICLIGSIVEKEWWITAFFCIPVLLKGYMYYDFKKKTGKWAFLRY